MKRLICSTIGAGLMAAVGILVLAPSVTIKAQGPTCSVNNAEVGTGATTPNTVLLLQPTVHDDCESGEAIGSMALGYNVEIATAAQWGLKTGAHFTTYQALVLGDTRPAEGPTCHPSPAPVAAAETNRTTWGPVVTGNVVVVGSDPLAHDSHGGDPGNETGAQLAQNGIKFAAAAETTGAYISLNCYYFTAPSGTAVPVLDQFGSFTVVGQDAGSNDVDIVNDAHPVVTDPNLLTEASLSDWTMSIHERFVSFPTSFSVVAAQAGFEGPGLPYILARGADSDVMADEGCTVEPGEEPNTIECPPVPNPDGVQDWQDNCVALYNPDQADLNEDGVGDACQRSDTKTFSPGNQQTQQFQSLDHQGRTVSVTFSQVINPITCTMTANVRTSAEEQPRLAKLNSTRSLTQQLFPVKYTDQLDHTIVYSFLCEDGAGNPVAVDDDYAGLIELKFPFHGDPVLLTQNVVDVAQARDLTFPGDLFPQNNYDRLLKETFPSLYSFTQASCDCFVGVGTDGFSDFMLVYDPVDAAPGTVEFSGFLPPYKPGGDIKKGTFPIKFRLTEVATGNLIQDPQAFITIRRRGDAGAHTDELLPVVATGGMTGNLFRYDAATGTHIFNWDMSSVPSGEYVFTLTSSLVGSHSGFVTKR